jgi:hypothetical protein
MRCAVVLALGDPRSSDAGTWIDAVAWLRQELGELGFRVSVIDGEDVEGDLARALEGVTPQDEVFIHVSGRLVDRGVVRTAGGRWVRLQTLADAIAACGAGADVSLFAELIHKDGEQDTRVAADHVASIVADIGAHSRGYALVAAVRPASAQVEGLALTRLFMGVARSTRQSGVFLSSATYERIANTPEGHACAQHFTFVRGASDRPLPSFETEPLASFESEKLPSFETEPLPSFASEPLPSFETEPLASFESEKLPSFETEPLPSFDDPPSLTERSLDDQIADATEAGQGRRVVDLRRERMRTIESGRGRVRELVAIARILQVDLADSTGAIEALEEARSIDPTRVGVLQALRRGYERRGGWEQVFELIGALADLSTSPADRAELYVAQALVARESLNDPDRGRRSLQTALENDPTHARARAAFDELSAPPAQITAADGRAPDPGNFVGSEGEATERLSEVADVVRSKAPACDDQAPDVAQAADLQPYGEVTEGELLSEASAHDLPESDLVDDPGDPAFHASAFAAHWREGRIDAAFLAGLALEELGAAEIDQQIIVDQFRSVAPIRARGMLDEGAWQLLRMTEPRDAVAALFAGVGRAAVAMRLEELIARKGLVALDRATCLDEKSTASIVRSFQWAARVLGVACPALYVIDEVPGEIAAVRAPQPSTALGPSVLTGRSAKELAFLAGRHLTYYRPEHQVLVYFPTGEDLTLLLLATIEIGAPGTSLAAADPTVAALCDGLKRHLTDPERAAITAASGNLDDKLDLGTWARGIELTAGRAGLLLCGDLATAARLVRSESRPIAGLTPDDRRRDLISFVASPEHRELRARFVVPAAGSSHPPLAPARPTAGIAEPLA